MPPDLKAPSDAFAVAQALMRQYGEDAETIATLTAAEAAAIGDVRTLAHWDNVIAMIAHLTGEQASGPAKH
jgi:hypothetical protein